MDRKNINKEIEGLDDIYGLRLRKLDFLFRKFTDIINRFGYEQLEVPLIERASSFSENIVGQSPWPEWDKRGCFYLRINNYKSTFENESIPIDALLIPEGTIPVTRWLGKYLEKNPKIILPLKIFYKLPCFRNEILDSLSITKRRQFNQFGLEILGTKKLTSDVEIIYLINHLLISLGIKNSQVRIRLSNVGIFNTLVNDCNISHSDSILLKEAMDTVAECRAGKNSDRLETNITTFHNVLSNYNLSEMQLKMWALILEHKQGIITEDMFSTFSEDYTSYLQELSMLCNELQKHNINSTLDLCVVRSHEYYTGISFEVDVITDSKKYIEIAGGGRYDKLVGNFVTNYKDTIIPSTGFAFGLERVLDLAEDLNLFKTRESISSRISFKESNADVLILLQDTNGNQVKSYFKAVQHINENPEIRYDIFLGSIQEAELYSKQKNIKELSQLK